MLAGHNGLPSTQQNGFTVNREKSVTSQFDEHPSNVFRLIDYENSTSISSAHFCKKKKKLVHT
jgi:hypothetical protein